MSEKTNSEDEGTITLKIDNISAYVDMTQNGPRAQSPQWQVAGIGWHVHAHSFEVNEITYLSCFLAGENLGKWSAWVDATFRIVKKNGTGFGKEASFLKQLLGSEPLDSFGLGLSITSEELLSTHSGYALDDSVEIRVDFGVTDVCETDWALAADIKLKVADSVFYANKGYLSVMSSAFRDMFALTKADENGKETQELTLKDLDAGEFKEFLGVIYSSRYPITGKLLSIECLTCLVGAHASVVYVSRIFWVPSWKVDQFVDSNVISLFRIAHRFDVKGVIVDCERHLMGVNSVPWFDKLKLTVDLNRHRLRDRLISKMTCDDIKTISLNENKDQLGMDVLQALFDTHFHHP